MKKKGYLLLELSIYIALASIIFIGTMDFAIFYSKVYKNHLSYHKKENYKTLDLDLAIEDILNIREKLLVQCFENNIKIYFKRNNSDIYFYEISKFKVGNTINNLLYKLNETGFYEVKGTQRTIINGIKDFKVVDKGNIFYVTIVYEDREDTLVYEK
ncbi:MAG: hypothetical protein ACRDD2_05060 [Sarcina sp.]